MNVRTIRAAVSAATGLALAAGALVFTGAQAVADDAAGAFVSDDFAAGALDTSLWAVTDPAGAGTVDYPGAGTDDARLALSVPAGVNYDIWGTNRALRATQPVTDTDFEAAAKFLSVPALKYQTQGILVEQDATNWLRFDVHFTGSALRVYAAKTVDGTSTQLLRTNITLDANQIVLRVTRTGDTWALAYSADGSTWTTAGTAVHPIEATRIGPFASNGSPYPAFTAEVDWFFDTAAPIDPEDGQQTVTHALSTPVVGEGTVTRSPARATYPAGTAVTLTAVPAEGWTFSGWSGDASGSASTTTVVMNGARSATATFVEIEVADPEPGFMSDDFASGMLAAPWVLTDPGGAGQVGFPGAGTSDARLSLSVPAGRDYDIWGDNDALRVTQPVADQDFGAAARFLSVPSLKFQTQGILVEQDADNWMRFDVHSTGTALRVYAAKTTNGTSSKLLQATITPGSEVSLRVTRQGDAWTLEYSTDGAAWTTVGTVNHPIQARRIGPFASTGSPFPAFTAELDWFFDTAAPIDPEDGAVAATYPLDTAVTGQGTITRTPDQSGYVAGSEVTLTAVPAAGWEFEEWAGDASGSNPSATITMDGPRSVNASFVEAEPPPPGTYALTVSTTGSGAVSASPTPGPYEEGTVVTLTATPAQGWTFAGWSGHATGSSPTTTVTMTADRAVTAAFQQATSAPPTIDVWYDTDQTFGARGQGQKWVNVLGNASDPQGISSLTYRLNGGTPKNLSRGPDLRRLYGSGDFNVQLDYAALQPGANSVTVTAVDTTGSTATQTITVRKNVTAPTLPHVADWSSSADPNTVAQVVDGKWSTGADGLTIEEPGYDRTVAVGSMQWTDFEARVPVTVRGLTPGHGTPQSGSPLIGFGVHWLGHTPKRTEEPAIGWYPTGAFAWFRWQQGGRFELMGNDGSPLVRKSMAWDFSTTYVMKVRAETVPGGVSYSYKWWDEDTAEPTAWNLSLVEDAGPGHGSLLLIAHHVDATFGDVEITELP